MSLLEQRARVAGLSRSRPKDDPDLIGARRTLAASRLEEYIAKTLAAAPPLTNDQRESLAALLSGPTHNGGVAP